MRPTQSLSDLMQDIKGSSSKWVNEQKLALGHFLWQEGYGSFSYTKSDLSRVISYIQNQEIHHRNIAFREEYTRLLKKFDIDYDERYIFQPIE
jgi:hypothetical protein